MKLRKARLIARALDEVAGRKLHPEYWNRSLENLSAQDRRLLFAIEMTQTLTLEDVAQELGKAVPKAIRKMQPPTETIPKDPE